MQRSVRPLERDGLICIFGALELNCRHLERGAPCSTIEKKLFQRCGQAVETPPESGRWVYTATAAVPTGTTVRIAVTVADWPGGQAQAEEEKVV